MDRIEELKGLTGIGYERYRESKLLYSVNIEGFKREIEGVKYFILIDSYGKVIETAYKYLNCTEKKGCIGSSDYKKKELAFTALKLLYSYGELFYLDRIEDINREDINRLDAFLSGGEKIGHSLIFKATTTRGDSTLNNYYSVYRSYFKYLHISDNIFAEKIKIRNYRGAGVGFFAHTKRGTDWKYSVSKTQVIKKETPKYISYKEYLDVLTVIDEKYHLREEVMIKLMYKYGLRLGEVLGLTIEDVIVEDDDGFIILRNRLTDKYYQKAKGCCRVKNKSDYNSPKYNTKNAGYQIVSIDGDDFELIQDYILDTRNPLAYLRVSGKASKRYTNLSERNIADKVTDREDINQNSYVFISRNGTPISNTAWNNIVKYIFIKIGVRIDKVKKSENLNHRFRHGFSMYKVVIENYDQLRLMKALRHNSPDSCKVYYTIDDKERGILAKETLRLLNKGGINIDN
ncbi:site-specific integrase [Clostridium estertheticum]|uniref:tyrosine-type recombinase/integrase n=1 Tax=Clostridium estertheticum TaxID=238834 RepID=UPI001C0B714B|nr:site-specific integrase [Clostridium estertheticum]MBU3201571.1 site-specific integrase [Clostridium estertheticum]WAG66269.1 site-specific integrase [Clostridium estertheticum]